MKIIKRARDLSRTGRPLDWLLALLLSWLLPIGLLFDFEVTYFNSLLLWTIPIALLAPRFLLLAPLGSPRLKAFWCSVGFIALLGLVLDFVLGTWVLSFKAEYIATLPALVGTERIPIEEVLFYILGAWAVLLVYVWCDEYWLHLYSVRTRAPVSGSLIVLSWKTLIVAALLLAAGVPMTLLFGAKTWRLPLYYSFLVIVAFAPAATLYTAVKSLVNWRAFSMTSLYVLLTSCIWEVTLGLPRKWWDYKETAILGRKLAVWSFPNGGVYPLEALMVWIAVTFACVLYYEFFRAFFRDPRPAVELLVPQLKRVPPRQE
jgi:hypothetical protein